MLQKEKNDILENEIQELLQEANQSKMEQSDRDLLNPSKASSKKKNGGKKVSTEQVV